MAADRATTETDGERLFVMENPFAPYEGTVMLLEDEGSSPKSLRRRLRERSYEKPFILDIGRTRYLHFSERLIQSRMLLDDPYALDVAYTRKMMAFLLFHFDPRNILLIGLGGGSLAKYCHRHLPLAKINVVEVCPQVIALRRHFMVPADDDRFRVVCADGSEFLASAPGKFDVILVDAFDEAGLAPSIASIEFYASARRALAPGGVFVMNFAGEEQQRDLDIAAMRAAFATSTIRIPLPDDDNDVVFAFRNARFQPPWKWLASHARFLKARMDLDFPSYARRLEHQARFGLK